jgi:hypothetical protein
VDGFFSESMDVKSIEGFAGCSNAAFQLIQIVKETTTETERFLAFGGAVPLGLSGGSGVKCDVSPFYEHVGYAVQVQFAAPATNVLRHPTAIGQLKRNPAATNEV